MKKINIIMIMLITSFVFMACEKEKANNNISANNENKENINNEKGGDERYEINYYLDTSPDTINILKAESIDGLYGFDQLQGDENVNVGYMTWNLASLGEAVIQELEDDFMVLELQNKSEYVVEFNILESSPEMVEFEIPVSNDKTLHYAMTDTEGELPIIGETFEEGQIISFGENKAAVAITAAIIIGGATIVAAGIAYCATRLKVCVDMCIALGMCADLGLCSCECYCGGCLICDE